MYIEELKQQRQEIIKIANKYNLQLKEGTPITIQNVLKIVKAMDKQNTKIIGEMEDIICNTYNIENKKKTKGEAE